MDTGTLPTAIPVPVEIPPGLWRREATHCPQPISPFLRGALVVVTECFRHMFSELGALPETLEYREIGGWVYTRLVPPGGVDGQPPAPELIRARAEGAVGTIWSDRVGTYLEQWPQWRSGFVAAVARLRDGDLSRLSAQELGDHFGEVMEFSLRAFDVHFMLHGITAIVLADLVFTGRELLGWDDARTLELLSGLSEASTEPASALARLTAMAGERPAVRRFVESGAEEASRLGSVDPDFASAFAAYQDEFGFRSIRYEVAEPTLLERPSFTLRLIADQLRSGYDPADRTAQVAHRREALRAEARTLLAGRAEADRARFERALDRAERWYPVREDEAPMTFSEPFALIRRVALEMGRRLAERSLIEDPDDIFFLETEEACAALAAALASPASGTDPHVRDLVRRRRAERAWVEAHPGPPSYGPEPRPLPGLDDLPPEARFVNEALLWLIERSGHFVTSHPQPGGNRLTGVPASGGTYTGTVRVLSSEADFDKLEPGDVLVCPITSPVWSVLFPNVGALVTDAGSLLSHSAIIAREFQIPAVVATGNATALLHDGQPVTVDGTTGSVEVGGVTMATALPTVLGPEQLLFLWEARAASALLAASLELGVLDRLAQGPVDAVALARDCGIRPETAPALLSALASLGLAEPDRCGAFVGVPGDLHWFLELLRRWDSFADGLRQRPEAPADAPPGADDTFCRTVGPLAALCAPAIGPATDVLAGAGPRVLDLGAGAAPWSLALAADQDVVVTAVDLPAVLPITRQVVAAAGREAQFQFLEGDIFTLTPGNDAFDLVILGNLCHLFDESTNRRLLGRVAQWLAPGGTVAVIDFLPNERRDGPRGVALYAVELVRRAPEGQLYPFSSYAGWLRETGFETIQRIELTACPPVTLVRARRPGCADGP